jgi:hypothetical protein
MAQPDPSTWKGPLMRIASQIRRVHRGWTWTKGGCFAFAEAFHKAFGGELYGVCRHDLRGKDWPVDHAVVRLGGKFWDFDGSHTARALLKRYGIRGSAIKSEADEDVHWFTDDFLNDSQWSELQSVMAAAASR